MRRPFRAQDGFRGECIPALMCQAFGPMPFFDSRMGSVPFLMGTPRSYGVCPRFSSKPRIVGVLALALGLPGLGRGGVRQPGGESRAGFAFAGLADPNGGG